MSQLIVPIANVTGVAEKVKLGVLAPIAEIVKIVRRMQVNKIIGKGGQEKIRIGEKITRPIRLQLCKRRETRAKLLWPQGRGPNK